MKSLSRTLSKKFRKDSNSFDDAFAEMQAKERSIHGYDEKEQNSATFSETASSHAGSFSKSETPRTLETMEDVSRTEEPKLENENTMPEASALDADDLKSPYTDTDMESFTGTYEDMTPRYMESPRVTPREHTGNMNLFFGLSPELVTHDTGSSKISQKSPRSSKPKTLEEMYIGELTQYKKKKKKPVVKKAAVEPSLDVRIKEIYKKERKPEVKMPEELSAFTYEDLITMNPIDRYELYLTEKVSIYAVAQLEKLLLRRTKSFSPFNICETVQDEITSWEEETSHATDSDWSPRKSARSNNSVTFKLD
jgi:hypothetical protein